MAVSSSNIRIGLYYRVDEKNLPVASVSGTVKINKGIFHKGTQVVFYDKFAKGAKQLVSKDIKDVEPIGFVPEILNLHHFDKRKDTLFSLRDGFVALEFTKTFKSCKCFFMGGNSFRVSYLHEFQNAFNATFGFNLDDHCFNL